MALRRMNFKLFIFLIITSLSLVVFYNNHTFKVNIVLVKPDIINSTLKFQPETLVRNTLSTPSLSTINLVIALPDLSKTSPMALEKLQEFLQTVIILTRRELHIHVITPASSFTNLSEVIRIINELLNDWRYQYKIHVRSLETTTKDIAKELHKLGEDLEVAEVVAEHILLSTLHLAFPDIDKALYVDWTMQIEEDLTHLYEMFSFFNSSHLVAAVHQQTPKYAKMLQLYKQKHPLSPFGDPPPNGKPGINTCVLLLHMSRMRRQDVYKDMIRSSALRALQAKYQLEKEMDDADFLSFLSFEHPRCVYILSCHWNFQLKTEEYTEKAEKKYQQCHGHKFLVNNRDSIDSSVLY
ncbi:glucoside xylosyltransferase 1-like [Tachypleus tridentatus]|uniref:glucoside xylosyltransferase 1-like n=1 Tax=Tachypleus tridentatus TaxID=6853 RepID=UPI003FD20972